MGDGGHYENMGRIIRVGLILVLLTLIAAEVLPLLSGGR